MPTDTQLISQLEEALNSFDPAERRAALLELAAESGPFTLKPEVNLHFHTFYSFNANNWSPSRIAWESKKYGLEVTGKVDFDVLDGMEEFLEAGEILGIKAVVGLETRVFIREYADKVINSPGEPGIAYFMAAACTRMPDAGSEAEVTLKGLYSTARSRTVELMNRVNDYLDAVRLDFAADVLPLTPAENATERHLLAAYDSKARQVYPQNKDLAGFWSEKLGVSLLDAEILIKDSVKLQETIRGKLMKLGGVAYVPPDLGSFPTVESVTNWAKQIDAIPCATWLDGTSPGEDNMLEMLELLAGKGVVAANIIPDRNWNIKNPEEKALKLAKLEEMVQAARKLDMPLCVGTEMNKQGLPFVDDFSAPELRPYLNDFLNGAYFFWGVTLLTRYSDYGYYSPKVNDAFRGAWKRKNKFYRLVGQLPVPSAEKLEQLRTIDLDPERLYVWLQQG